METPAARATATVAAPSGCALLTLAADDREQNLTVNSRPTIDPRPALSIVIPFFNEADSAPSLLAEIAELMERLPSTCELVLVDDGSTDSTPGLLDAFLVEGADVHVIHFRPNLGQGASLFAGIRAAGGNIIATLDGDGQNDPADIVPLLVHLAETGSDMVVGQRSSRKDSPLRRAMSRVANFVRSRLLRDGVSDSGCAIKVFRTPVRDALIPLTTLYSFIPALAVGAGFTVTELPVNHRPRIGGTSSYGFGSMLWRPTLDMLGIFWFNRRRCSTSGEHIYPPATTLSPGPVAATLVG